MDWKAAPGPAFDKWRTSAEACRESVQHMATSDNYFAMTLRNSGKVVGLLAIKGVEEDVSRTSRYDDPGTTLVHFPGDEPCDGFLLAIFSEDKVVLSTEVLQDGIAMPPWKNWARVPSKQDVLNHASENLGLELKTKTRPDGHEWTAEIRIPLSRLQHFGHQVFVESSGNKGRLYFYPKTRVVDWTPNAS